MKKILFSLCLFFLSLRANADQHQIVSEEYAIAAVELISMQSDVIAWCDCCGDNDYMKYVRVVEAYYEYTGEGNDCYVFLSGFDQYGNEFLEAVDLAYIFIPDGELAARLSDYIGLPSEYCSELFSYYEYYPFVDEEYSEDTYYVEDEEYYDSEEEEEYDGFIVDYGRLSYFECGDYCHLGYENEETGSNSGILYDPSEFPGIFIEDEYGYTLNPGLIGSNAYITFQLVDFEYMDGTSGMEYIITNVELAE